MAKLAAQHLWNGLLSAYRFMCPRTATALVVILWSGSASAQAGLQLEEQYLSNLDRWVSDGERLSEPQLLASINRDLGPNCGKLVMLVASNSERSSFLTAKGREEYDFRVDVCIKMTVNRVHPQPEFAKAEIVQEICTSRTKPFAVLCQRSGLMK